MDTLKLLSRSSGLKLGNKRQPQQTLSLPSEGDNNDKKAILHESNTKKRKRDEDTAEHFESYDESQIRQIQKQHKIRIVDLKKLHDEQSLESRKAQKEGSRIFPQPLQKFSQLETLKVNQALRTNITAEGYTEPTEVQLATIPLLLEGGKKEPDLLTVAPTGSGKTLAYLIPLINKISLTHQSAPSQHVSALILAPTKELVGQIVNEGRKLALNTGVRIAALRKGMHFHSERVNVESQSSDSEVDHDDDSSVRTTKVDIIVSTPLSLVNAVTDPMSTKLLPIPHIKTLILDEADVLLDPLFRDQTLPIWSACTSADLRISFWSATIGSSIEELAITTINDHHKSATSTKRHSPPLLRVIIGLKDTSLPSISHQLIYASNEPGKLMGIRQLLHPPSSLSRINGSASSPVLRPPFLIFTQSIDRAQSLYKELQYDIPPSAGGSTRIAVLHSSLSSKQRSDTMTAFRLGKVWILITTDLLSRGVDFRGVNGVVNYDIPTTAASYVHRAGRTGRAGRSGGICVTLYTKDDVKYLKPIANIIAASQKSAGDVADTTADTRNGDGLPTWLIPSLPHLTKSSKKDLKTRGVEVRRNVKQSDDDKERKIKLKNRIGTMGSYERKLEARKKGMSEASRRRKAMEQPTNESDDEWGGLGD